MAALRAQFEEAEEEFRVQQQQEQKQQGDNTHRGRPKVPLPALLLLGTLRNNPLFRAPSDTSDDELYTRPTLARKKPVVTHLPAAAGESRRQSGETSGMRVDSTSGVREKESTEVLSNQARESSESLHYTDVSTLRKRVVPSGGT
ncbi:hypothetical protein Q9L58_008422 [Maublancomyces gigas]|uniref:Uncharacterized protein n=1 Tax=Discina gigas TaxID=1032678 RepID=A0ABR3GA54_9PEZI